MQSRISMKPMASRIFASRGPGARRRDGDTRTVPNYAALPLFGRTARERGQLLQLRAIAWYGVRTAAVGGGRSPLPAAMAAATSHGQVIVIAPDDAAVAAFLNPQPCDALRGIGPATAQTPGRSGIQTIGQLAQTPTGPPARLLDAHAARELYARARELEDRSVQRTALVRSTSTSHTFDRDELHPAARRRALPAMADELGLRLRSGHDACRALTLTVRYADRSTSTRTRTPAESPPATPPRSTAPPTISASPRASSGPGHGRRPCGLISLQLPPPTIS